MTTLCITALLVAFSNADVCTQYKAMVPPDPSKISAQQKKMLCSSFKLLDQDVKKQIAGCSELLGQLVKMIPTMCETTGDKKRTTGDKKRTTGDKKRTTGDKKRTTGKPDDKKPSMTDEQKQQACKAMGTMMTGAGVDLSADPSKMDKEKLVTLCQLFKRLQPAQMAMFAGCSAKHKQLVDGGKKLCTAGDKKTDDKKPDRKPDVKKCENPTAVSDANCKKRKHCKNPRQTLSHEAN